jgi:ribA/ribD-fused uncharacterized protein
MKYTNNWLIEKHNTEERIKYLFFWGHQPSKDGSISSTCLSQWWLAPFTVEGIVYQTAEHWMMAEKARLFNDEGILKKIIETATPAAAKKLGRKVSNFDPEVWDAHKSGIVVKGNYYKFFQDEALRVFLVNTQERVLVEASPVDKIWGIGMAKDHADINNPEKWKGANLLGYALMEVRDQLTPHE